MLTLGLETSGQSGTVAVRRDGMTLECVSLETAGRRHAQTLATEVDRLLRVHGHTAKDLTLIAVSVGPGSFTGLRVGVVFAKTLSYALNCPVAAVDTLAAIAANSPADVRKVVVVADAQRGEFFLGRFAAQDDSPSRRWVRSGEITIASLDEVLRQLNSDDCPTQSPALSGPAADSLSTMLPTAVRLLDREVRLPRADVVAELGEALAVRNELADVWQLEPFYLRRSAAEEKASQSGT